MEWPLSVTVRSIAASDLPRAAALAASVTPPSGAVTSRLTGQNLVVSATTELAIEFALAAVLGAFPDAELSNPEVHYTSTHEPYCLVRLVCPAHQQELLRTDLLRRHGRIVDSSSNGDTCHIQAEAPLIELFGYATEVHAITQGLTSVAASFIGYKPLANRGASAA